MKPSDDRPTNHKADDLEVPLSAEMMDTIGCSGADPAELLNRAARELRLGHARQVIHGFVEALPDQLREVIEMRFWGLMTYEEVASRMGCDRSTAYRRELRALAILREWMEGIGCTTSRDLFPSTATS